MKYRIERAGFDDVEDLCAVQAAAIEAFGGKDYSDREINAWVGHINLPHILGTLQHDDTEIFVARGEEYGRILGFSAIKGNQITDMYVDPDFASEGIGTTLLRKAEWHLLKNGEKSVCLLSTKNSVGFYEENGYNGTGERDMPVNDDVSLEMLEMRKRLSMAA